MKISAKVVGKAFGSAWFGWLMSSGILFTVFWALEKQSTHPSANQVTAIVLMIIVGSLPNALVAGTALGVWWYAIATKRGLGRRAYLLAGLGMGAAVGLALSVVTLVDFGGGWWWWALVSTPYASACGGIAGWCLWRWLHPDRSAPNPPTSAS